MPRLWRQARLRSIRRSEIPKRNTALRHLPFDCDKAHGVPLVFHQKTMFGESHQSGHVADYYSGRGTDLVTPLPSVKPTRPGVTTKKNPMKRRTGVGRGRGSRRRLI